MRLPRHAIPERRGGAPIELTAVRANFGERRANRRPDRKGRFCIQGEPLRTAYTPQSNSKTAEGNLVRVRLPLSAPRIRIQIDRISLSSVAREPDVSGRLTAVLTAVAGHGVVVDGASGVLTRLRGREGRSWGNVPRWAPLRRPHLPRLRTANDETCCRRSSRQ